MSAATSKASGSETPALSWLMENGPRELEILFRTIIYHPSAPILIADDDRKNHEASIGASHLLGVPREKLIGRQLDDFTDTGFKPQVPRLWKAFLKEGEQDGVLRLLGSDGKLRDVEYSAKSNILPSRNLIVMRDKSASANARAAFANNIEPWVRDFALYLLDPEGTVVAWYAGAMRMYGYNSEEAAGHYINFLYPESEVLGGRLNGELTRAATEGHIGTEEWQARKDGSQFWANSITMALRDKDGELHGFARVVRDFSERHERDDKLRRGRKKHTPADSAIAGVASGEFDRTPDINDALLSLIGYTRADLQAGRIRWPDLTPPEYEPLDEIAHEEGLRFGACTPYEKEFIRKDGSRIPVLVATAVLKLAPFRWISFVQDLRLWEAMAQPEEAHEGVKHDFDEMVGGSAALKRVLRQAEVVAPTDANVLILGETGTGKELVARAIHRISPRRNLPFVTLNCAAIPTGLLESELFGYERGAFTGALSQKIGRFEMAHRGTLFLDEVGDIPLDLQPKLLRALQEKSFERLGGTRTIPIDVRLVAATNRNLTQMMGDKLFRSDLYYRLKVFPILTPPLRDRPEDIPILTRFFVAKYSEKMGRHIDTISAETMRALVKWNWPGNVRELENFIERSVILSDGSSLRAPLSEIRHDAHEASGTATLEQVEREHIIKVLKESGGVVSSAATRLGLHRTTLNAMMRKLGITRGDF